MKEVQLVDQYGNPIKRDELEEEVAFSTLTGVRPAWIQNSIAGSLTPQVLASLIQNANAGHDFDYLTLAEEMEERELHYGSVLSTRRLAVEGLETTVEAGGEDSQSLEIADAVRNQTKRPEFGDLVADLLDGLGKGRSTVEVLWRTGKVWEPASFVWRDPRYFQWHTQNAHELRLRDEADLVNGIALAPYKFITHVPRLRTGIPVRRGMARLAAAAYMLKSFTLRDWMAFSELFGMPIRVGKYDSSASPEDKATLRRALANLGSDAAAMIPKSMDVSFIERSNSSAGHTLFKDLAEFLDKGISKAVLGQVASTEGTAGKLGNDKAQEEVRGDIKRADAKQVSNTLTRDFVIPFVNLNYGVQAVYPRIVLFVPEKEDTKALVEAITKLVPFGLRVGQGVVRDKLGLPDPDGKDEVLVAPAQVPIPNLASANNRAHVMGCQCSGCSGVARNQAAPRDAVDDFVESELSDWQPIMESVVDELGLSDLQGESEVEVREAVAERVRQMGGLDALVSALALASFKARVQAYVES